MKASLTAAAGRYTKEVDGSYKQTPPLSQFILPLSYKQENMLHLSSVMRVILPFLIYSFLFFCVSAGFKRGADPGMPEPTVLRYCVHAPFVWGGIANVTGSMSAHPLGLERHRDFRW